MIMIIDPSIQELFVGIHNTNSTNLQENPQDNLGNVDNNGNRVKHSIAPEEYIFMSNASRTVDGIKQEKAKPEQWLAMIQKAGGLKAAEDKCLGLSDWLKPKGNEIVSMEEVMG